MDLGSLVEVININFNVNNNNVVIVVVNICFLLIKSLQHRVYKHDKNLLKSKGKSIINDGKIVKLSKGLYPSGDQEFYRY
ncbi:hypothetical protein C4B60_19815 [Jeotgalibacillus proteolyticus]|uniref:Uncharacterized protein n=1 Tax=Jeotgalibacillus proteolyticus TaxID=2082395 RepID=A0A2S5G745_9BACL|nr:hypothetical protein C4B60_19385 [Jeotgalibacillus proteolyticus]PPA68807.1 hypothetical protein C4B60_19815 [Jeotgalibacillus proteolyticus]